MVVVYGKLGGNAVHGYRFLLDRVLFLLTVEDLVYRGGNIILKGLYNSKKKLKLALIEKTSVNTCDGAK